MRFFKVLALASFLCSFHLLSSATLSHALRFDVFSEEAMYGVNLSTGEVSEDPLFTINPESGEVVFGDGLKGSIPPTGGDGIAAAYRYGSGSTGAVLTPFVISLEALPILIPFDDPSTDIQESEFRFFLSGIASLEFELTDDGLRVTGIETSKAPVPEPATIILITSGLLGLLGLRRRRMTK